MGGITLLGPILSQVIAGGAAALQAGENRDPTVAAALFDLGNMAFILFPLPAAVMVAATCLAGTGTLLPRWEPWLPLALMMVVATWSGLAPLSFTLLGLWLAIVAVVLTRRAVLSGTTLRRP